MKRVADFVLTTIVGGVFFLLPVLAAALILKKAATALRGALEPVVEWGELHSVLGPAASLVLAVLILVLVAFVAGLLARTRPGRRVGLTLEGAIRRVFPGITLFKSAVDREDTIAGDAKVQPALANIDDAWLFAFILERHDDGRLTVLVPSPPEVNAGSVYILEEVQVRRLKATIPEVMSCIRQLGVGAKGLFEKERTR